eukprot:Skav203343  [mRNA]  locus=scaffold464:102907:109511:- [translate_table: standard]
MRIAAEKGVFTKLRSYVCSISNQIDVVATMPWYAERIMVMTSPARDHSHLEKMAGSLRTLRMVRLARMVRLLRVLRLAKVARHSEVISIVLESLVESATGIFVLMSFVSMWALICATVVYAAEWVDQATRGSRCWSHLERVAVSRGWKIRVQPTEPAGLNKKR